MSKAAFGLMGLGVMGENLALNLERNGFPVAVWDREPPRIESFLKNRATGKQITGAADLKDFAAALERPRKILMMVKAGAPIDWTIAQIKPFLEPGDILIDGGNSYFEDTRRRESELASEKLFFVGMGVSGGEKGALHGPSLMPGGRREAYDQLRPILEAIAAKASDGPCVTYLGPDAAGHFVKMIHNGIEYADMQLIAEAYDMMRRILKFSTDQMADVFAKWNEGLLESYLIEITSKILRVRDPETGNPLVEMILDQAGQKGTGRWTAAIALELEVPIPTIHAAIEARVLSNHKAERVEASGKISGPEFVGYTGDKEKFVEFLHDALYAGRICSFAQGMALLAAASKMYQWQLPLAEVARIWKDGCIIRARILSDIQNALTRNPDLPNLLAEPAFAKWLVEAQTRWRKAVSIAATVGAAVPAMFASLAYFDTYRAAELPQNLTQAQRDFFGAHTYQRKDQPQRGAIHTNWYDLTGDNDES